MNRDEKIAAFAALLEADYARGLVAHGYGSQVDAYRVTVKPGRKYVKVDVGMPGKYLVTPDGEIIGIKGYGVPHWGHRYGTLDTIGAWDWSGYAATHKSPACSDSGGEHQRP